MKKFEVFEIEANGKKIEFQIRNWAQRTNGEVIVRCGDTQVLATCAMSPQAVKGLGYFPLSVNYEERYYAAGKILGPRYIKREGRPSDNAVIISRIIDRAIRPLFPENLTREVQVIITCLSWDEENDPDILGILGASFALAISDIPWKGPIGAAKIGAAKIGAENGKLIYNPIYSEQKENLFNIIWSGLQKDKETLINMVEGNGKETQEDLILQTVEKALPEIKKLVEFQNQIVKKIGKEKIDLVAYNKEPEKETELENKIKEFANTKITEILFGGPEKSTPEQGMEKAKKLDELKAELIETIEQDFPEKSAFAKDFFETLTKQTVQEKILKQEKRVDGRKLDEIRPLSCEVGLIPRAHGSSLFCRGLTKALSILTLGGPRDRQLIEGMEIMENKRFLHHYNFPPYSTGETKFLRAPSRREIGHGMLGEKALLPVLPDFDKFPYTIRIVSEMVCSNGSTSMASVCAACLALMDAGVPIKSLVAGIAIGLVQDKENPKNYKLLTDIQGPEDFFGDMDFKVAGTTNGITAIQMDVKVPGITKQILKESLAKSKKARLDILGMMKQTLSEPRQNLSAFAPKIYRLKIPVDKIGEVIGPRGHTIKGITEETGAIIDVEPEGIVYISSEHEDSAKKAMSIIKNITREIKAGEVFLGQVKKIVSFGAFLELVPGQEGLLHTSQTKEHLKIGDKLSVKVIAIDKQGRINLGLAQSQKQYGKNNRSNRKY